MRCIPLALAALLMLGAAGCGSSKPYHNLGLTQPAADPAVTRTALEDDQFGKPAGPKTTVSDSVMIGEQGEQGYRDSLAPF